MADTTIFMSAGDDSGDLHAANFMEAVKDIQPDASFIGFGMERMREAGLEELSAGADEDSAMWLHNLIRIGDFYNRLNACRKLFAEDPPDLVVLVDFGGFNLYVARAATRADIPVVYYILPQVWAHGRYRLKKIRKWVTRPLVIYPFEPDLYAEYDVDAEYVGHPLFDHLEQNVDTDGGASELKDKLGDRGVALFPGSRKQEVHANLPIMLEAAERLQKQYPELRFASVVPSKMRSITEDLCEHSAVNVTLSDVDAPVLADACELCLTKSGTITLEIAAMETPMVIFYRVNPFFYFLGAGVTETPYIGLINNLSGRMVCPEKAMPWADVDWVVEQADDLLGDGQYYESCRREMEKTLEGFAEPGASVRAARAACELLP